MPYIDQIRKILYVFVLYLAGAFFGQFLSYNGSFAATMWPPTGILIAFLLLNKLNQWPSLILAGIFANIVFDLTCNRPFVVSLFYSTGNIAEVLVAVFTIKAFFNVEFKIDSIKQLFTLFLAAVIGASVSATIGYFSTYIILDIKLNWLNWFSGDVAGIILFTPIFISTTLLDFVKLRSKHNRRIIEIFGLITIIVLVSFLVYEKEIRHYPAIEFILFVPLLWAAYRFTTNVTFVCNLIVTSTAIWATSHGFGPFAIEIQNPVINMYVFQIFIGGVVLISSSISIINNSNKISYSLLKDSEARLIRAERVSNTGNWEIHLDNKTVTASEGARILYGLENMHIDFPLISSIPLSDYRPMLNQALIDLISNDIPYDVEFKIKNYRTGEIIDIHSVAIYDKHRETIFGVIQDITESKRRESELEKHRNHLSELVESRTEELDALNRELISEIGKKNQVEELLKESLDKEKHLNQLKTSFISTASHEFKTPLTSILSSIELIKRYGTSWSEERKTSHYDRIILSVDHLTSLIDDVLQVSKVDSGKLTLNRQPIDLHRMCSAIIEEVSVQSSSDISINMQFRPNTNVFNLDPKQIYSVILNLTSNAVKYSPNGGNVEIIIDKYEERLNIEVEDSGIGIPENDLPFLFEPFFRSDEVREIKGTGLGLTIVKNAVELHDGSIEVKSELGKGTKFKISIPV